MNTEGTDITTPKSTVTVKSDDPNVTIDAKLNGPTGIGDSSCSSGTTGTSGSNGPSPIKDPMKGINKKYYYKGKYPKPR